MAKSSLAQAGWLMLLASGYAVAQESDVVPVEEPAAAESSAPAEASADAASESGSSADSAADSSTDSPADSGSADGGSADSGNGDSADSGASDSGSSDSSASDSGSSDGGDEAVAEDDGEPLKFYVGFDRTEVTLDLSKDSLVERFGTDKLDGGLFRGRVGMRLFPGISAEAVGGFAPDDADRPDELKIKSHYAAYIVPTGTVLDVLEVSARIGWASFKAGNNQYEKTFDGWSFGIGAEFPIRVISESLPDLRLTVGGTVLNQDRDERAVSWQYGLRYDFSI